MQLALWNTAIGRFLQASLPSIGAQKLEIELHSPAQCVELLRAGYVDVALAPTLTVLRNMEDFDILPAIALSTWKNPYTRIDVRKALPTAIQTLACSPLNPQALVVSQIILKEHYGVTPQFVPKANASLEVLAEAEQDAALLEGDAVPHIAHNGYQLDLSQEWYELANYPLVSGLFVTPKGHAYSEMLVDLKSLVKVAEVAAPRWAKRPELTEAEADFYASNLRLRLDDLAVASLTEFQRLLFFYKVLEEVDEIMLVTFEDAPEDEGDIMI